MRLLDSCSCPRFPLRFLVFQWGKWIVFSSKSLFPLIIPLETENIPSVWLDQDVNLCSVFKTIYSSELTNFGDL